MIVKLSLSGDDVVHEYAFNRTEALIGSGRRNDLHVPLPNVALRHARLRRRADRIWLEPLKPGTTMVIERRKVGRIKSSSAIALLPGDCILLGEEPEYATIELIAVEEEFACPPERKTLFRLADPPGRAAPEMLEAVNAFALRAASLASEDALTELLSQVVHALTKTTDTLVGLVLLGPASRPPRWLLPDELGSLLAERGTLPTGPDWHRRVAPRLTEGEVLEVCGPEQEHALLVPLLGSDGLTGVWTFGRQRPMRIDALQSVARPVTQLLAGALDRLAQARELRELREENRYFRGRERRHYLLKELVVQSPAMKAVYEKVNELVHESTAVWILGEKGTGKEMIARALHHLSGRADALMISENCGALSEEALDVELFGRGESASEADSCARPGLFRLIGGGTLFLEEIGRLPPRLQTKLGRAIQECEIRPAGGAIGHSVDLRIIVSSERDLFELVETGRFRKDLYLQLAQRIVHLPPLRERVEDIVPLANVFVSNLAPRYRKAARTVSEALHEPLRAYSWPGNVRQLQGYIEAAVVTTEARAETITVIPGLPAV